jgi:hypothetical protein
VKKILRNFRLSPKTIQQIEELSRMSGDAEATAIVTQAIQEKHEQFWFDNSARLHPRRDGRYDVEKQGKKIAIVEAELVNALPQKMRDDFLGRGVLHGEIDLLLGLANHPGDKIEIVEGAWSQAGLKKIQEKSKLDR